MKQSLFFHTKRMCRDVPAWVPDDAVFFITICCTDRVVNSLTKPEIAFPIFDSLKFYQDRQKWWIHFTLLMPDHIHTLVTFNKFETMDTILSNWKRFIARQYKVSWQKGFFDHRIRNEEQFVEKYEYIRYNPVRKEYVNTPEEWLYYYPK